MGVVPSRPFPEDINKRPESRKRSLYSLTAGNYHAGLPLCAALDCTVAMTTMVATGPTCVTIGLLPWSQGTLLGTLLCLETTIEERKPLMPPHRECEDLDMGQPL